MRICDLTTLFIDGAEGGVNTYLAAKALDFADRRDVRHVIVVPGAADRTFTLHASTVHVLESRRLPWDSHHRVLFRGGDVARLLRLERPSIVEVDCASFLGRTAKRALGESRVPIVGYYHVHLPTFIARPAFAPFGRAIASTAEELAWRYVRRCCRPCDRVLVPSEDIRARLEKRGVGPVQTVPLGVDLELFRPEPRERRRPSAARPRVILAVSRLSREKDLAVLLRAFRLLSPPERYRLEIIGVGPLARKLEAMAFGDERIAFRGACRHGEALALAYRAADVYVNPSPNETFGLTLLEAMACGVPVVAMRQGGPIDLVTPEVGELATPGDAEGLAAAIARVASRPDSARVCRSHVERRFSWRRTFDRLMDVYDDVSTAGGARRPNASRAIIQPAGASVRSE